MKMKGLIIILCCSLLFVVAISFYGCKDSVVNPTNDTMISPWSIAYDNEFYWVSDDSISVIFKMNSENKIVLSYHLLNKKIKGITSDGAFLWAISNKLLKADKPKLTIYKIAKTSGNISDSIIINIATLSEIDLYDICYYNSKLYVSFNGGWGPCLFEINHVTKELERQLCCAHPCGLAKIDGEMWCVRMNREDGCGNSIVKLSFTNDFVNENIETKKSLTYFASDFTYANNQLIIVDRDSKRLKVFPFNK